MAPTRFGLAASPDPAEQADLSWAALEATARENEITGLCWWNCLADGRGGRSNTDYTPFGKLAAVVLSTAWTRRTP